MTTRAKPAAGRTVPPPPAGERRPRIQDVAQRAGVSLGTVSAVLNGKGRLADSTRDRVQAAMRELGYRPDLYASNLARRQTKVFGVIVSNLQNPFFAETAQAVEEEAERHGFQISLMATNFSIERHRAAVLQLLGARLAGLAVLTSEADAVSRERILASGIPAAVLDVGRPAERCSVLRVDARAGMRAAVEHLIALGHRRLLYVRNSQKATGPPLYSHRLREQGFAAAVRSFAEAGIQTHAVDVHGPGADAGQQAIAAVHGQVPFTAVVATTDMVAMGVYRALGERGVRIPAEVSVVGFDNTAFSRFMNPPLTTVDISRAALSEAVIASLMEREPGRLRAIPTSLIVRESTAAAQP